jgi:hypothetical protein
MKHTKQTQLILTAAFFFSAASGMMAQSVKDGELVALNTTTVPYQAAAAPIVANPQPQPAAIAGISSEMAAQPVAQPKPAPTPSTIALAKLNAPQSAIHSDSTDSPVTFTTGAGAFPNTERVNPTFLLPRSQYGAAPIAVKFSFGKK